MSEYTFDFTSIPQGFDPKTITLTDVVQLIDNLSLEEIVGDNMASAFSADSTTYLYSGDVDINGNSVYSGLLANAINESRTIDKTVAAKFLSSSDFAELLKNAMSNDISNGTHLGWLFRVRYCWISGQCCL